MRALVVDPDPVSAKLIHDALESEGILAKPAEAGEDAIDLARDYDFDVLILETQLPDTQGFEVLRRLRALAVRTPVLMLSVSTNVDDTVRALADGADDYLAKPFETRELIARIRAVVRRSKGHPAAVIKTGMLALNLDTRSVEVGGRRLPVTPREYSILELLSLRKDTTVSKEMFLDHLYGGIDEPDIKEIDKFISKLRKKIGATTGGMHYIETVWGRGYVLKDPNADAEEVVYADDLSLADHEALDVSRAISRANSIIDSEFLRREFPKSILPMTRSQLMKYLKAQLTISLLVIETKRDIDNHVVEIQFEALSRYAIAIQHFVHIVLTQLASVEANIEQEKPVVEGNLVRTTGSRKFGLVDQPKSEAWISESKFSTDSFNMMADFAKCLRKSKQARHRLLCNVLFIIELLKMLVAIFAQLVPLAGGRS
jgi:two-component system cell cycle response regulator CtrA